MWENCVVLLILGTLFSIKAAESRCPSEPRGRTVTFQSTCYEFIKPDVLQTTAKQICHGKGGRLLTIPDKETQAWLKKYVDEELKWDVGNFWLGLERSEDGRVWSWNLGDEEVAKPIDYSHWAVNEPDSTENRKCAYYSKHVNAWVAATCIQWPFTYSVVCEYNGPSSSLTAIIVGTVVGVLVIAMIIISIVYCYKRRKALMEQLRSRDPESPTHFKEHIIKNTDNNMNITSADDCVPQPYGEVTEADEVEEAPLNNYNFNIIIGSTYERPKVKDKDLSLNDINLVAPVHSHAKPGYNRSISLPAQSPKRYGAPLSPPASAPPCDDTIYEDDSFCELSPLQRPHSVQSNDLS